MDSLNGLEIAVIGMAGRFPGADNIDEFWQLLQAGKEGLRTFSDAELRAAGATDEELNSPNFVRKQGVLAHKAAFDAPLFGYSAKEAQIMDPQFRVMHETVWEALEHAGYDSERFAGLIGLYAGAANNIEWMKQFIGKPATLADLFTLDTATTIDYLNTRIAYKFNFQGPVVTVQSACSTSMVAIHQACQSLNTGECDMALAGGVCIASLRNKGYVYQEGMIMSADGTCRPFDAKATGTNASEGCGVLVLKRLEDAQAHGDTILAVIKGSAVNNDGRDKMGYTALGGNGQLNLLHSAYQVAEVDPETISYLEAHSTGTPLGDPIEIEALTRAFASSKKGFCKIGSVKSNIGHTMIAAGVASMIKTILAMQHRKIPPTINFDRINPHIDIDNTPFTVNTTLSDWCGENDVLRAGVSSFGVGGTNAHLIVENFSPATADSPSAGGASKHSGIVFTLSANSAAALANLVCKWQTFALQNTQLDLTDVCYTLHMGRKALPYRLALSVRSMGELAAKLTQHSQVRVAPHAPAEINPRLCFLFWDRGEEYASLARALYRQHPDYRRELDACFASLTNLLPFDVASAFLTGDVPSAEWAGYTQPLSFCLQYALARLLMQWGCRPSAVYGQGVGEYVGTCIAGVLSLADALALVVARNRLSRSAQAPGSGDGDNFYRLLERVTFNAPGIDVLSAESGGVVSAQTLGTVEYWRRQPDRDAPGAGGDDTTNAVNALAATTQECVFVAIGHGADTGLPHSVAFNRHGVAFAYEHFCECLGELFVAGVGIDWTAAFYSDQPCRRVALPTYPFERKNYSIQQAAQTIQQAAQTIQQAAQIEAGDSASAAVTVHRRPALNTTYVAPESALEIYLAALLQDQLGIDRIGRYDSFFELGADSLLGVRLINKIREHYDVDLSVKHFLTHSCVADFAGVMCTQLAQKREQDRGEPAPQTAAKPGELETIALADRSQPLGLSFAQQRLWLIDRMEGDSAQYNIPAVLAVAGTFNPAAAEQAIARIVQRHEALRTVFIDAEEGPVQRVCDRNDFRLVLHDLTTLSEGEQQTQLERLANEDRIRPFDLSGDLMVRAAYVQLGAQRGTLLFNIHHIAADGWSMGVLIQEFVAQYQSVLRGEPDPLPPLAVQYADYAVWQRRWLQERVLDKQLSYWRRQLEDVPVVHDLPLRYPRPEVKRSEGMLIKRALSSALSDGLKHLARAQGVTLFMLLHAALGIVLSRHSNNHDIVIGTPVANRGRKELEPLIGFFANTLVLRVNTQYDTFTDYLAHIREVNLAAQEHQDLPFEVLVDHCRVPRTAQHTPLFQIMLSIHREELRELAIPGLHFSLLESEEQSAKFDLDISAQVTREGINLSWFWDKALFSRQSIDQLHDHMQRLLTGIVANPQASMRELPLLSEDEKDYLLYRLNDTRKDYPAEICVHRLIEKQVSQTPERVAYITADRSLTYAEVNAYANGLSIELLSMGVAAGDVVPVLMRPGLTVPIALLAIMKTGAVFAPIDVNWPDNRIEKLLANLKPKTVLTSAPVTLGGANRSLVYDVALERLTKVERNPDIALSLHDPIYIIHTSGSTGEPKGAINLHRGIVNRLFFMNRYFGVAVDDVILQTTHHCFDSSVWQYFWPLLNGGRTIVQTSELLFDLNDFLDRISIYKVTVTDLTPALLNVLVEALGANPRTLEQLASLKTLIVGGDTIDIEAVRALRRFMPALQLINAYGPTETSIGVVFYRIADTVPATIPIGRPIDNVRLYVLDEQMNLCPPGVAGELYIGGDCVGAGYIGKPVETSQAFVEDAFSCQSNSPTKKARLYKTGDLVRYLDDGNLEFIGRKDKQVKIRGYRIELGEIESVLLRLEAVHSAMVLVREDKPGAPYLVAYVRLDEQAAHLPPVSQRNGWLSARLRDDLPEYMLPSAWVYIDQWPLTANGKVDKKALPAPDVSAEWGAYAAPVTQTEKQLAALWAALLAIDGERLSIDVDFFQLGGHSLLLIRLLNAIEKTFGLTIDVRLFFKRSTVRLLAQTLDTLLKKNRLSESLASMQAADVEEVEI